VTRLVDLGEYALHKWLASALGTADGALDRPGDDCAFLDLLPNHYLLVTSDRLPLNLTGEYAGRLVVTQSFSDIVSKGGQPKAFLLDVFLPRDATLDDFQAIVLGARREAERYGAHIAGGDTKEDTKLTVVGVGIGLVEKPHRISRAGARPGDVVAMTLAGGQRVGGRWAKAVVDCLGADLAPALRDALAERYARDFQLPCREMQAAVATGRVTAATDNSDGLGGSLQLIGEASGVGFVLARDSLLAILDPILPDVANALAVDVLRFAFAPGYDWQCVVTVARDGFEAARRAVTQAGGDLVAIGGVTADRAVRVADAAGRGARLALFTDEKFKSTAWEEQPRRWLTFDMVTPE
jgi:thiamine-monophosphate kinase